MCCDSNLLIMNLAIILDDLLEGPQTKKSNLMSFSCDYCSMLVVPKYFLSHPETESPVTFLTDKRILLFA